MIRLQLRRIAYFLLFCLALYMVTTRVTGWLTDERLQEEHQAIGQTQYAQVPEALYQRYLVLYHDRADIPEVKPTVENIKMALGYAKLPYDVMTYDQWAKSRETLDDYRDGAVILVGERQASLAHLDRLRRYVTEQGGLLVNAIRSSESPLNDLMGMSGEVDFLPDSAKGWRWKAAIYPGLSEQQLSPERVFSTTLDARLTRTAHVWAEAVKPEGVPYVWWTKQGKGHTLYWNTVLLQEKLMRGSFIQTMLKAQGTGAKTMVGAQVWFIDDFPSPAYNRVSEGNETGMTDFKFRLNQWDPDMQAIAKKYNIRYSTGTIFTYNERVSAPFSIKKEDEREYRRLFEFETGLAQTTGELGLHGYNHLPLTQQYSAEQQELLKYPTWSSTEEMVEALTYARSLWQQQFPQTMPTLYIPPSNILSSEGKRALLNVFPELKTISSLYQVGEGSGAFEQEFLPDPDFPDVMGTPRVTYGYALGQDEKHDLYSVLGGVGVVSHFNHPDDVFHANRNEGLKWPQLRDAFDHLVGDVQRQFPFLQKMTATELSDALRRYHLTEAHIDRSQPDRLTAYLTPLAGPMILEVRVEHPSSWQVAQGGEIVSRKEEYGLLWVKVTEPKVVLEVIR